MQNYIICNYIFTYILLINPVLLINKKRDTGQVGTYVSLILRNFTRDFCYSKQFSLDSNLYIKS